MANRLLTKEDTLAVGDILILRNRFDKKKYAIMQVEELERHNGRDDGYFYAKCIKSHGPYREGQSVGCDFYAHAMNDSKSIELTYIVPAGNVLFSKQKNGPEPK